MKWERKREGLRRGRRRKKKGKDIFRGEEGECPRGKKRVVSWKRRPPLLAWSSGHGGSSGALLLLSNLSARVPRWDENSMKFMVSGNF